MNLLITGYGRMGRMIEGLAAEAGHEVLARIDVDNAGILPSLSEADVVMDFSSPALLPEIAAYVKRTGTPLLSGTTGGGPEFFELFNSLGEFAPVLHSANYSLGIAVLKELARLAAGSLPGFDIEIVEAHHNKKADAPSGTAKLLADAVDPTGELPRVYGREGVCPRGREIGMHAVRGGTVAGEHSVLFFGPEERVALSHSAESRAVFAHGALAAAGKLIALPNGAYTLRQVLFTEEEK